MVTMKSGQTLISGIQLMSSQPNTVPNIQKEK